MLNTNIIDRVEKVAPFLKYDSDPTMVVDKDGSLKWVIDAYTTTEFYPYSQYTDNFNYIRNSVKVVVDAYHGTTKFYIIDKNDPVVKSYSKGNDIEFASIKQGFFTFPKVFKRNGYEDALGAVTYTMNTDIDPTTLKNVRVNGNLVNATFEPETRKIIVPFDIENIQENPIKRLLRKVKSLTTNFIVRVFEIIISLIGILSCSLIVYNIAKIIGKIPVINKIKYETDIKNPATTSLV